MRQLMFCPMLQGRVNFFYDKNLLFYIFSYYSEINAGGLDCRKFIAFIRNHQKNVKIVKPNPIIFDRLQKMNIFFNLLPINKQLINIHFSITIKYHYFKNRGKYCVHNSCLFIVLIRLKIDPLYKHKYLPKYFFKITRYLHSLVGIQ